MFTFLHFAVVVVLVLFILYVVSTKKQTTQENFDTYYQHDAGAAKVLDSPLNRDFSSYIRYNWAQRDQWGYNMYDKMYDNDVIERNSGRLYPHDYDTKFTTRAAYDMPMEAARDMKDPQTAIIVGPNLITLQQKNRW